jgi:hypothetical protein
LPCYATSLLLSNSWARETRSRAARLSLCFEPPGPFGVISRVLDGIEGASVLALALLALRAAQPFCRRFRFGLPPPGLRRLETEAEVIAWHKMHHSKALAELSELGEVVDELARALGAMEGATRTLNETLAAAASF